MVKESIQGVKFQIYLLHQWNNATINLIRDN